jgi:hypothetical protein
VAIVPQCDRCKALNVQVVSVLGCDLCNRCVSDFRSWATNVIKRGSDGRAGYGERMGQAHRVIARDGYVTSSSLASIAGITRIQANGYLHERAKRGALKFDGFGRFVLPDREAAE